MSTASDNPFPLETLFPGIHAARPDIARHEAETFLEHGAAPGGFDLDDPAVRMRLLTGPGLFVEFRIHPLPSALAALVNVLPHDWQERPECHGIAEHINECIEKLYGLQPDFYVSLNERREAWVGRNRA